MTTFPSAQQITDTLTALPEEQRAAALEGLYARLDHVADRLGLPTRYPSAPTTLTTTASRPRREVWRLRLNDHHQYAAMPDPVCEHLLNYVVAVETSYINQRLERYSQHTAPRPTEWAWDPDTTTATRPSHLEPAPAPDLDAYLDAADIRIANDLDHHISRGVRDWIAGQAEFLDHQGWQIAYAPDRSRPPEWTLDPIQKRLDLRVELDLDDTTSWLPLNRDEAAQFPTLTAALIRAATESPDPVATAFPAAAAAVPAGLLRDTEPAPITAEYQEGPVR